jgi:hypothetical protein
MSTLYYLNKNGDVSVNEVFVVIYAPAQ